MCYQIIYHNSIASIANALELLQLCTKPSTGILFLYIHDTAQTYITGFVRRNHLITVFHPEGQWYVKHSNGISPLCKPRWQGYIVWISHVAMATFLAPALPSQTAIHLKIGDPKMKFTGTWITIELHWHRIRIANRDNGSRDYHRDNIPFCRWQCQMHCLARKYSYFHRSLSTRIELTIQWAIIKSGDGWAPYRWQKKPEPMMTQFTIAYIDGLEQDCCISSALAMDSDTAVLHLAIDMRHPMLSNGACWYLKIISFSYFSHSVALIDSHVMSLDTPECLTCEFAEDCQYVSASFSKSAKFYILNCQGPGVPQYVLRSTQDGRGKFIIFPIAN